MGSGVAHGPPQGAVRFLAMRPIVRDILTAAAPVLAGFGLAWAAHKADARTPANVTAITHQQAKAS
jgi:hypothetical protein